MVEPEKGSKAVIVASEPLSEDKGWIRVKPNHLVVVHDDLRLDMRTFSFKPAVQH